MKSYKSIKKKLVKLQKTNSRTDVFLSGWFFKVVFCFIVFGSYVAIVTYAMPNFENSIIGNESWSIALIALPVALFGIYISVLLPLKKEMNNKVLGVPIRKIHKSVPSVTDYRSSAWIFIFFNTDLWIYYFIKQDYKNMIAIAIYLSLCFIYLIFYAIWLYSIDPIGYYCKSMIRLRIKKTDFVKILENTSLATISSLSQEQIEKVNNYIITTYAKELKTIDMLFLEMLCKENAAQAKQVLCYIINDLENSKFSELNIIITNKIVQRCLDIIDELIKREEFLFLFNLISSMLQILNIYFAYSMANLTKYISIVSKNTPVIGKNILEFNIDCQPLLLKHLLYYNMLSRTNKNLADISNKVQSLENSLKLFASYCIKTNAIEEIETYLKQYNETIRNFITIFQEIDKTANR